MKITGALFALYMLAFCSSGQIAQQDVGSMPNEPKAFVESLYTEVIARHPMGISEDAHRDVFDPYLSEALLHRLETYNNCVADYLRKNRNKNPGSKPELGLFENNIFSGGGDQVAPSSFKIDDVQSGPGGAVTVIVRLSTGAPQDKPWVWGVRAILVREGRNYRVNDIIYLNEQWGARNTKLSEYLSLGCNGPRWNGK